MELNTKKFLRIFKKYFMLISIIIISVGIGTVIFMTNTDESFKIENSVYAIENEQLISNSQQVVSENISNKIKLEDIINKNKVILEKIETETEEVPFETVKVGTEGRNSTSKVITNGKNGTKKVAYKVRYEDDVPVNKIEINSVVTKKAVNEVVQYAVASTGTTSRSGIDIVRKDIEVNEELVAPVSGYSKVIDMKFTSYCLCKKCTGKSPGDKGYGVTASGYVITPGKNEKVVAVDPSVIPLGSRIYVQGVGVPDYGYALAVDTGGAIKGNKIDLYVDEHGGGPWWTVGNVKVYVLD